MLKVFIFYLKLTLTVYPLFYLLNLATLTVKEVGLFSKSPQMSFNSFNTGALYK